MLHGHHTILLVCIDASPLVCVCTALVSLVTKNAAIDAAGKVDAALETYVRD